MSSNVTNESLPAPEPEHCPGPASENAGKSDACAGCPNQNICKTTPKGPDPGLPQGPWIISSFVYQIIFSNLYLVLIDQLDLPQIQEHLRDIKHKILVLSGKGGVGKSTVSSQLAFALSGSGNISGIEGFDRVVEKEDNSSSNVDDSEQYDPVPARAVGLLDIDICGPSIPRIMGLDAGSVHQTNLGWEPVYVDDNLSVMSVGFLLGSVDDAVIWRGPKKNGLIKQFVRDVNWGELDYLVIDTPPGTSDEHLSITTYLKSVGITGAIIVTTPQEVSLSDVRKEINFCKKVGIPILGVIENMSGFVCSKCNTETKIFFPTSGGAEKMCQELQVNFLGRIPIDPLIAKNCDEGKSFVAQCPQSVAAQAYKSIFEKVIRLVEGQ